MCVVAFESISQAGCVVSHPLLGILFSYCVCTVVSQPIGSPGFFSVRVGGGFPGASMDDARKRAMDDARKRAVLQQLECSADSVSAKLFSALAKAQSKSPSSTRDSSISSTATSSTASTASAF